ncbi:hypothetical protein SAMN04488503_2908 [Humidesulfovibrio mexicanus]|uniref:Uncharacterized protein n=1 Tax=Humidesulfovibrio mexicanus TaxID=147047 RepID=A0A239C3K7_9BACT|nr:hypothetical protein [Humidesulfovibrio mexicanus]SNS14248.1 hypothetical protein SAMN04488503_2908 [Humidesulfovibrio mexicanus]
MPDTPAPDSPSLAGLAAANGPWLADRLLRLASQADLNLDREVAQAAVDGASRVLAGILAAEGRAALRPDENADPAFALGREQGQAHRQAGFDLSASLKTQRLLRRAYDDLVRESWVEKDTRSRAHEDVERFFERALAGLVAAWTGHAQAQRPAPGLTERLALREDQLRRAMDAAKRLTTALRESRQRAEVLAAGLELARGQAAELQERLAAREAACEREAAQAEAEHGAVKARVAELQVALAARGRDREEYAAEVRALRERLDLAQAEAQAAQADADRHAEALRAAERRARELSIQAEAGGRSLKEQEALLARLRSERAALADEAEAMRARLAETGSRLAAVRAAEGEEALNRIAGVTAELEREKERTGSLSTELEAVRGRAQTLEDAARTANARLDDVRRKRDALQERLAEAEARCAELDRARSGALEQAEQGAALRADLERDMERLLDEVEAATRGELGQSLAAFIRLPQELLDDPATPPGQAAKLADIRDSGYRLVNTVNLAVDVFRMERGRYRPPAGRGMDLAAVLRRAAKNLASQAAAAGVEVAVQVDGAPLAQEAAVPAPGDPLLARALVERLLCDALHGCASGAALRAAIVRMERGAALEVSRPGVLPPQEAQDYFAKPRPDDADFALRRARHVSRLLAQALGGSLDLRQEDGRVVLAFSLPMEDAGPESGPGS